MAVCYSWQFPEGNHAIAPPGGGPFTTSFPSTQTPLNDAAITVGTQQDGAGTSGPSTTAGTPGRCFAPADDKDYFGFVQGRFSGTQHYSEVVVRKVGGYAPGVTHEVEVHVGGTATAGSVTSYEMNFWVTDTLQPVRWEDPLGTFNTSVFTTVSGGWAETLVEGDVIRVEFDSTSGSPVITVKLNNVTKVVYTDTTAGKITAGSPGFAFFTRAGVTYESYCIKGFSCGSL